MSSVPQTPMPNVPGEPEKPIIKTSEIPGPKSKELWAEMNDIQDPRHVHFFQDSGKSVGNYVADADGNMLLDVFCHISSIPLGYNSEYMIKEYEAEDFKWYVAQRPALGVMPPMGWPKLLKDSVMKILPHPTLDQCFTSHTGSDANEIAFKVCFMYRRWYERTEGKMTENVFTPEELETCMVNQAPGCPDLSIISFKGAFHGRTFGALSATRSKAIHKIDIPLFDWPQAEFPALKYPLKDHEEENHKEEERCLALLEKQLKEDSMICGLIVEPVQAEGGDKHASPFFFKGVREITKKYNVLFIVDEVQTGMVTGGHIWAHQEWELDSPPDMVTFGKKSLACGFYHNAKLRPSHPFRNFSTWVGDPIQLCKLRGLVKAVEELHLVENARITGKYMLDRLLELEKKFPKVIHSARGQGTFQAIDFFDVSARGQFLAKLRMKGIQAGPCGEVSVRLRPALVFAPKHAKILLDAAEEVLAEL